MKWQEKTGREEKRDKTTQNRKQLTKQQQSILTDGYFKVHWLISLMKTHRVVRWIYKRHRDGLPIKDSLMTHIIWKWRYKETFFMQMVPKWQ